MYNAGLDNSRKSLTTYALKITIMRAICMIFNVSINWQIFVKNKINFIENNSEYWFWIFKESSS